MASETKYCEDKCPYCNSENIDYTSEAPKWEADGMLFFYYCLNCDKEFEVYCIFEYEETRYII